MSEHGVGLQSLEVRVNAKLAAQELYIDNKVSDLERQLSRLEALLRNANATSRWSEIHPIPRIGLTSDGSSYSIPSSFPNRMAKFWHLRSPTRRQAFLELLEFYQIYDDDDLPQSLSQYVNENLDEAHERLAVAWNLSYPSIKLEMQIATKEGFMDCAKRARQLSEGERDEFGIAKRAKPIRWTPSTTSTDRPRKMKWTHSPRSSDKISSIETSTTPKKIEIDPIDERPQIIDARSVTQSLSGAESGDTDEQDLAPSPVATDQSETSQLLSPTQRLSDSSE